MQWVSADEQCDVEDAAFSRFIKREGVEQESRQPTEAARVGDRDYQVLKQLSFATMPFRMTWILPW